MNANDAQGTNGSTFDKKTIWHSEVARLGEVEARLTSEPQDSQYPDKPKYVQVKFRGDNQTYYLNLDNEAVEEAVRRAPKNQWLLMEALGAGKDEESELRLSALDGQLVASSNGADQGREMPAEEREQRGWADPFEEYETSADLTLAGMMAGAVALEDLAEQLGLTRDEPLAEQMGLEAYLENVRAFGTTVLIRAEHHGLPLVRWGSSGGDGEHPGGAQSANGAATEDQVETIERLMPLANLTSEEKQRLETALEKGISAESARRQIAELTRRVNEAQL